MKQKVHDAIFDNSVFIWIALATAALLAIPLIAMRFTTEFNWDEIDFIVMAFMVLGTASLFVLAARAAQRKHRVLIGALFIALFLYVWAELAVGIFTDPGS